LRQDEPAAVIVIAASARPSVAKTFSGVENCALTNASLFDLADLPASTVTIGAGLFGLKLAQALVRLNVDTPVFDEGRRLAG
jgi:dihydrolipoamide dehydrogenase